LKRPPDLSPLRREGSGRVTWSFCELSFIDEYPAIQKIYNVTYGKKAMKK